jgi:hypothetical protein
MPRVDVLEVAIRIRRVVSDGAHHTTRQQPILIPSVSKAPTLYDLHIEGREVDIEYSNGF